VRIDRRLLGWGLFLIIVGAIPLLVRGGYLDADLVGEWPSLWPVLLIGWGLGLVLRRTPGELLGSAISVAVLGIMVGGLISTGFGGLPAGGFSAIGCGDGDHGTSFGNRPGTLGDSGRVGIEFNCGTLAVNAVDGSDWSIHGTGPDGRGPDVDADVDSVSFTPKDGDFGFFEDGSEWRIDLPRTPTLDLGVTLNAGEGSVDLEGATLDNVSVTLNAGSIDFALAGSKALSSVSATVNAGSATFDLPEGVDDASMTLNAGSIEMCVPAGTAIRISWSGALGSNNFDAAGLDKIDDGHWQTSGLSGADALELSVSANAGSFSLDIGGSCDA
jgi:hypothetical protein